MEAMSAEARKETGWLRTLAWLACLALMVAVAVWALSRLGRPVRGTVGPGALPGVLPTEVEMAALMPGARVMAQGSRFGPLLESSPGFLAAREQQWGSGRTPQVRILAFAFYSQEAAIRAHEKWMGLSGAAWDEMGQEPVGERCRYEAHSGWSIEFFRGNVYAMVNTSPGSEKLARGVARLVDSKVRKSFGKP